MPTVIQCAACGAKLKVPDTAPGKPVRCPKCKAAVPVNKRTDSNTPARGVSPPAPTSPGPATTPTTEPEERQRAFCPYCDEEISPAAIKCKHCGEMLTPTPRRNTADDSDGENHEPDVPSRPSSRISWRARARR